MHASTAHSENGPSAPSAASLYAKAREVRELAQIAAEVSLPGARQDIPRAAALLDQMRAVLG